MNRKHLIALSLKYEGDYKAMSKAIVDREPCEEAEAQAITILDDDYPSCFLELPNPPLVLFYKGNIELLKRKNTIGIVGSRVPCEYAIKATKTLIANRDKDLCVVSGLSKGIATIAHTFANETIGVLGCGIDYYYPFCNKELIDDMSKNQLIISEYPAIVKPFSNQFADRNRLIASLSNELYIMQSTVGKYDVISEAIELGREVKVLPYEIFDESGIGNMELIREGATPISRNDLLNLE